MEQRPDILLVELIPRLCGGKGPHDVDMSDHHALGLARRAGGVDDVGKVGGVRSAEWGVRSAGWGAGRAECGGGDLHCDPFTPHPPLRTTPPRPTPPAAPPTPPSLPVLPAD